MRELIQLKQTADYDTCDQSGLDDWLKDIGQEFRQYTYQMVKAGVDRHVLQLLNDDHLFKDCQINNGIHRLKIIEAAKSMCSICVYYQFKASLFTLMHTIYVVLYGKCQDKHQLLI